MGLGSILGLDDLIGEIGKTARQIIPDPQAKRDFEIQLQELGDRANARIHEEILGQIAVNTAEAQHESIFVAGWRPAIGWCCAGGLLWNFLLAPVAIMFKLLPGMLPIESLITLVVTMLGASGIRTFERVKGVSGPLANPVVPQHMFKNANVRQVNVEVTAEPTADLDSVPADKDAPWNKD